MRRVLLCFLLGIPGFASAVGVNATAPSAFPTSAGWNVSYTGSPMADLINGRTYTPGPLAYEVVVRDGVAVATSAGNAAVTASRTVTAAEVALSSAKWLATAAVRGSAYAAAAGLLYDAWRSYRARPDGSGGIEVDEGTDSTQVEIVEYNAGYGWAQRADTAAQLIDGHGPGVGYYGCTDYYQDGVAYARCHMDGQGSNWIIYGVIQTRSSLAGGPCPEAATGAMLLPGEDGKCPTGRYTAKSQAEAAQMVKDGTRFRDQMLRDHVDLLVKANQEIKPKLETPSLEGPAKVIGPASVQKTTQPDGTVVEKTTTPSVSLSYPSPGTITKTPGSTTTEKTTSPSGVVTQGPTTETQSTAAPSESDLCEKYPDILACSKLGTPPSDAVPTTSKDVTYSPESTGLPSSCPADIPVYRGVSFSMQEACDISIMMRPLVLAAAALCALMICVGAIRGAS